MRSWVLWVRECRLKIGVGSAMVCVILMFVCLLLSEFSTSRKPPWVAFLLHPDPEDDY